MKPEHKAVWRTIGITAGVLLILSGIVVIIVIQKKKREEQVNDTPTAAEQRSTTTSKPSTNGKYTKEEVENMQSLLLNYGFMGYNQVIIKAIQDTGGIDGVIGDGFYTALNEAIKQGYFESLDQLYYFANRKK